MGSEWTSPDVGPRFYTFHKSMIISLGLIGLVSQGVAIRAYIQNYKRLNSVIRAFGGLLLADTMMVLIHLPQSIYAIYFRHISE